MHGPDGNRRQQECEGNALCQSDSLSTSDDGNAEHAADEHHPEQQVKRFRCVYAIEFAYRPLLRDNRDQQKNDT